MDNNIGSVSSWLFISDLDDTLIGDDASLQLLVSKINKHREKIIMVFNSSRPCKSMHKSLDNYPDLQKLKPDFLVGALGTEIEDGFGKFVKEYSQSIIFGWNREKITKLMEDLGLEPHPQEFQTQFKASYNINGREQYLSIKEQLAVRGFQVKVIFSGGNNLDIIPFRSGKGSAVDYIKQRSGVDAGRVVVSGDSGNDIDMFLEASKGIIVGNADHELMNLTGPHIYKASASYAAGVLEGLYYWGVIPSNRPRLNDID
jgi:sucrose-6-phosphatase